MAVWTQLPLVVTEMLVVLAVVLFVGPPVVVVVGGPVVVVVGGVGAPGQSVAALKSECLRPGPSSIFMSSAWPSWATSSGPPACTTTITNGLVWLPVA